ncbi:MAG: DNA-methyltransferase [Desulfosalsimonas sp.]
MASEHRLFFTDSRSMGMVSDQSIDLVATSPPYPMIEMWDKTFSQMDTAIGKSLEKGRGWEAYEGMHAVLDLVWKEVCRVLKPGGFACINIGDAVRKMGGSFFLYPNHSKVLQSLSGNGLSPLPAVIWRKQTNAPNKFMGSGMLPAGAYVTLEHEYILIFRKGEKREFLTPEQRENRHCSAIFWEERNRWFSDVWLDLKGARQHMTEEKARRRSGAYPFELPYRLINMYSVMGDTVLDPFAGVCTTMFAAMASCRNSVMIEIEPDFLLEAEQKAGRIKGFANNVADGRILRHLEFASERKSSGRPLKYTNEHYGFPVMTRQETRLKILPVHRVRRPEKAHLSVDYTEPVLPEVHRQQSLFENEGK